MASFTSFTSGELRFHALSKNAHASIRSKWDAGASERPLMDIFLLHPTKFLPIGQSSYLASFSGGIVEIRGSCSWWNWACSSSGRSRAIRGAWGSTGPYHFLEQGTKYIITLWTRQDFHADACFVVSWPCCKEFVLAFLVYEYQFHLSQVSCIFTSKHSHTKIKYEAVAKSFKWLG